MLDPPVGGVLDDEDIIREDTRKFVEPSDLAPSQSAGAGSDGFFGVVGGKGGRSIKEHFFYADGLAHRRVRVEAALFESFRFSGAVSDDLRGADSHVAVEV